ncbi:hypothetical protein DH2020_027735 [Rehmannia glutinosa]|uniref:Pectinesterase n=1 Tax=Rehmannia glutinosa TaxID=99300 RepID=A0ABR0VTB7_REHGL
MLIHQVEAISQPFKQLLILCHHPIKDGFVSESNKVYTAVAALIQSDKSAFYRCGFFGLQDTLWDVQGRHYFRLCTIQGAVDFIFGSGQSLYEATSQLREDQRLRRQTDSCLKIAAYQETERLIWEDLGENMPELYSTIHPCRILLFLKDGILGSALAASIPPPKWDENTSQYPRYY